ncbi:hypothetical protein F2Q70_00030759 [Brassica cretica]|uniref:Uncharacterized protein n=1 Tax=Brassica cretica TaxID=69181 RepID=A0A8S9FMH3_BRACR|nr:hypothetical protein F2Q70_00030759 [Brassica cretica]
MTMPMNRRKGQVESKTVVIKKDLLPFTNRTELKEGNDVPQSTDHYMDPAQHGVQDVLNISTEVHVFHRTRLDLDHARLEKDHARLEKDQARLDLDHETYDTLGSNMVHDLDMVVHTDSPPSVVLLTAVHASGYNESGHKPNSHLV